MLHVRYRLCTLHVLSTTSSSITVLLRHDVRDVRGEPSGELCHATTAPNAPPSHHLPLAFGVYNFPGTVTAVTPARSFGTEGESEGTHVSFGTHMAATSAHLAQMPVPS